MDDGVPKRHGEASGCHCSGVFGCGLVLLPEAGAGARDGCCHCEGIYSTFYHWLCVGVHFPPGQRWMDPPSIPFHGLYSTLHS